MTTTQTFEGYNPNSETLMGPWRTEGSCIDGVPHDRSQSWSDSAVVPSSGDLVSVLAGFPNGATALLGKRLQRTRDGRWWLECSLGALPLSALHRYLVAKVVRVDVHDAPFSDAPDPALTELTAEESLRIANAGAPALTEWRCLGYPPPEPLPSELMCKR